MHLLTSSLRLLLQLDLIRLEQNITWLCRCKYK